jgi:hypothetical protein
MGKKTTAGERWDMQFGKFIGGRFDRAEGLYKGVVEDVQDPFHLGRVRVRVYSIHGDRKERKTGQLPWCEPVFPIKGSFCPPELFDRVWIAFENGDTDNPVYIGYWYSVPAGRGSLPTSQKKGIETPKDSWRWSPDDYPQAGTIFETGEGSILYTQDEVFKGNYKCRVELAESGNAKLSLTSFRQAKFPGDSDEDKDARWWNGNEQGGWEKSRKYRTSSSQAPLGTSSASLDAAGFSVGSESSGGHTSARVILPGFSVFSTVQVASLSTGGLNDLNIGGLTVRESRTSTFSDGSTDYRLPEVWK